MNRVFSWPRLLSNIRAAAAVAVAFALLDVFLAVAFGHTPGWLPGAFDAAVLKQFGSRLARAEQLHAAGRIDAGNMVAVIGLSPVREDCDSVQLNESDPEHRTWLVLGAQGRTFATLEVYVRGLAQSAIHPRQVVLGIMPSMLHQDDHAAPVDAALSRLPHHLRHFQIQHVLLDLSWIYRNRDSLADLGTFSMFQAMNEVRSLFGLPMAAAYSPEADIYKSWTSVFENHADAGHMVLQWQGHQQLLVPEEFQSIDRQVAALSRIVALLRTRGAEVVLVLMPETTRLRAIYPPQVEERFFAAVQTAAAGVPLNVRDMRGAIRDDEFWDDGHLNPTGRQAFSVALPASVREGK